MRTWIKICGTTSLEDALASVAAGADALGFIFAPSKRRITPAQAREIVPVLIARLRTHCASGHSIRVIKTVLVDEEFEVHLKQFFQEDEDGDPILLDSGYGSGKTFAWERARPHLVAHAACFIIAGGLSPENVERAVRTLTPWGVDVASGVEREPGRKDPEKLKAFVAAVRKAELMKVEER